ncbi:MAG: methyltransferase [Bacilli bacterium]|nr:methyltransferase [Bacilli bacterium]
MEHYFTNNDNLKSDFRTIIYKYNDYSLEFTSDLGVFSKDKVDFGSKLLMETFLNSNPNPNITLLDVGCGYGIIGITLSKIASVHSTLVDVNKRALHLAKMNAKKIGVDADIFESDVYSNVTGKYDVIITNPPIRAGKQKVMQFLLESYDYLKDDGELWVVMRKDQGAKSAIEKMKSIYSVEVREKSKGFFIIVAKKLLTSN